VVTCLLRIGDRVVLSSPGGAPEVEYALFDAGDIELAATGPGMVQEVGYRTTAGDAAARLEDAGITWDLALACASAMQPTLAMAYARGSSVRRIATAFGPAELFEGFRYDPAAKQYEGRWIDLPAIGVDLAHPTFTQAAQAMHLLELLREVGVDEPVHLATRELMATARKGGRSYRRGTVPKSDDLPDRLEALGNQVRDAGALPEADRSGGPTLAEIVDAFRDRAALTENRDTQDRVRAIEKGVAMRHRPLRGPMADPQLWALEEELSAGRHEGAVELLDAVEASKGRQPATAYLRARAAFVAAREAPRAIAERVASLALTMPSFVELELLAAEAWSAAGDPKRALPFARDLVANATVTDELRVRESQQLAAMRPSQAALEAARVPARPRTLSMDDPAPRTQTPARITASIESLVDPGDRPTAIPEARESAPAPVSDPVKRTTQPIATADVEPVRALSARPPSPARVSQLPPPASSRRATPPMMFGVEDPGRPAPATAVPTTRSPLAAGRRPISGTWVGPPPPGVQLPTQTPTARPTSGPPATIQSFPSQSSMAQARPTSRPPGDAPRLANRSPAELMRGASQPPFRSDSPDAHVHVPRAAPVPKFDDEAEAAGALTLPEGLSGVPDPIETLPRTVLDARVQFTFLARELGREYDEQLGITLRADISGVESMQRVLLERYTGRSVATPEAAQDVRRHGAFLSEILARSFGAFWVDIGPSDVGYWAMLVPPGTRVWPFGRILRLIAMQHNERDLVSYFLELQSRAARR
jgi:hypothetical protein